MRARKFYFVSVPAFIRANCVFTMYDPNPNHNLNILIQTWAHSQAVIEFLVFFKPGSRSRKSEILKHGTRPRRGSSDFHEKRTRIRSRNKTFFISRIKSGSRKKVGSLKKIVLVQKIMNGEI
jgi:hypothetical protein